jgi:hypothetical protein
MSPRDLLTARPALPWWTELLVAAILSGGTALYLQTSREDKVLGERVAAIEAAKTTEAQRLDRIETKLDHIIEQMLGERPKRRD